MATEVRDDLSASNTRHSEVKETSTRNNDELQAGYLAIKSSINNFKESDNKLDTLTEEVAILADLLEYLKATALSLSTPYVSPGNIPWLVDDETITTATNVQNGLVDLLISGQMVANTMKFLEEKVKLGQEEVRRKENELKTMSRDFKKKEMLNKKKGILNKNKVKILMEQNDILEVENKRLQVLLEKKEVENERLQVLTDRKEALLSAMKEECMMMARSVPRTYG